MEKFCSLILLITCLIWTNLSAQNTLIVPLGHTEKIIDAVTTTDGRYIVSLDKETALVWKVESSKLLKRFRLKHHESLINKMDPMLKAVGNKVFINLENYQIVFSGHSIDLLNQPGSKNPFNSFDIRYEGYYFVVDIDDHQALYRKHNYANSRQKIILVNTKTGTSSEIAELPYKYGMNMAWSRVSPNKRFVAVCYDLKGVGDFGYSLAMLDLETKHLKWVKSEIFAHSGTFLGNEFFYYANSSKMVKITVDDPTTQYEVEPHQGQTVRVITYNPHKNLLTSAGDDQAINVYDVSLDEPVSRVKSLVYANKDISISPNERYLASLYKNGLVTVYDLKLARRIYGNQHFIKSSKMEDAFPNSIGITDEGKIYLGYRIKGWEEINIKDKSSRMIAYEDGLYPEGFNRTFIFPEANIIAAKNTERGDAQIFQLDTAGIKYSVKQLWIRDIDVSVEHNQLLVTNRAPTASLRGITVLDLKNGSLKTRIKELELGSREIVGETGALHYDGNRVILGSENNQLYVISRQQKSLLETLNAHGSTSGWITDTRVSEKQELIASSGTDQRIAVFDGESLKRIYNFDHGDLVDGITFWGDRLLISYGTGKTVFWDTQTGNKQLELYDFDDQNWLVVSPDGLFEGTEAAMDQLHYVNGTETMPVKSFYARDFQPNLFLSKLKGIPLRTNQNLD